MPIPKLRTICPQVFQFLFYFWAYNKMSSWGNFWIFKCLSLELHIIFNCNILYFQMK